MKLRGLLIEHYRSIEHLEISFEDNINLLIGPNGCGKTNILDAINNCFKALLIDECRFEKSDRWFEKGKDIRICAQIEHRKNVLDIDITASPKSQEAKFKHNRQPNLLGFYKYIRPGRSFQDSQIWLKQQRYELQYKFRKDYDDSKDVFYTYFDMLINSPYNLEELSQEIAKLYPDLKNLYFSISSNQDSAELIAIINDFAIPVHLLASGLQQLLKLIVNIYYSKDNLILIDEPSLHMNPKMIMGLSDLIKRSSIENGNQFIIGTHSPALISTLGGNIIPLEYGEVNNVYTTYLKKVIPNEFIDKSKLISGE